MYLPLPCFWDPIFVVDVNRVSATLSPHFCMSLRNETQDALSGRKCELRRPGYSYSDVEKTAPGFNPIPYVTQEDSGAVTFPSRSGTAVGWGS
jgi:hypothetical protein